MTLTSSRFFGFGFWMTLGVVGLFACGPSGPAPTPGETGAKSDPSGQSKPSALCNAKNVFKLNGTIYQEQASVNFPKLCQSYAVATIYPDKALLGVPFLNLVFRYDLNSGGTSYNSFITANVYEPKVGKFPIGNAAAGKSQLVWNYNGSNCDGDPGSITLTQVGPVGGKIEGTISISSFTLVTGAGPCPSSLSGSFSLIRDKDTILNLPP